MIANDDYPQIPDIPDEKAKKDTNPPSTDSGITGLGRNMYSLSMGMTNLLNNIDSTSKEILKYWNNGNSAMNAWNNVDSTSKEILKYWNNGNSAMNAWNNVDSTSKEILKYWNNGNSAMNVWRNGYLTAGLTTENSYFKSWPVLKADAKAGCHISMIPSDSTPSIAGVDTTIPPLKSSGSDSAAVNNSQQSTRHAVAVEGYINPSAKVEAKPVSQSDWVENLSWCMPKQDREPFIGDLREDRQRMRERGESAVSIEIRSGLQVLYRVVMRWGLLAFFLSKIEEWLSRFR